MKISLWMPVALGLVLAVSSAHAGVAVNWVVAYGAYDNEATNLTGNAHALLESQGATWQLVFAGPNHQIDAPDLSNGANGWAGGDDVVWAVRVLPQSVDRGAVTASDGTVWNYWMANESGVTIYEDLAWVTNGFVYQRVYQGTPAELGWYFDSALLALNTGYEGVPAFPQEFMADSIYHGFQPNRQASASPVLWVTPVNRAVGSAAGTALFAVANTGGGEMIYQAETADAWLEIAAGGAGTNGGTITVAYQANSNAVARTGTVTVAAAGAGGSPLPARVVQAAAILNTYYRDADGDGYGNPNVATNAAVAPAGYVSDNSDWNDANASVYPGAPDIPDGMDNDGDGQIDEGARDGKTCFALAQAVGCTGAGWSRTFVMDLTNFRNLAVQDGYQSYAVAYALYYNIWTGVYLYDYDAGAFSAVTWLMNLDL